MPRPPRTTDADTLYHVWVRATGGGPLFVHSDDRQRLLRILKYTCEKHGWLVYAYAQLTTHHHMLVWTPEDDLSRGMQLLSGVYAQTFNRERGRFGHLVSARFSSKIVETEAQAKELCRYIVLNPVRAGMCERPEQWPWSSYRATLRLAPAPAWLHTDWVVRLFGRDVDEFRLFVDAVLELELRSGV
jgi:REP-associated tyrosine transposase